MRQGNASLDRVLKHSAGDCKVLQTWNQDLWRSAINESCHGALGAVMEAASGSSESILSDTQRRGQPLPKKAKTQAVLDVTQLKAAGKKAKDAQLSEFQDNVDHVIMWLICVHGLVPNIIDTPEWKELLALLNINYHPTSRDTFANKHIPREAVFVREKQIKILKELDDLTLTFDGTTTRKPHSVYTVHATTPARDTYFLDGHEGSNERHTLDWVTGKLMKVCIAS